MKSVIILIIGLILIGASCAKQKEEKPAAANTVSERLEIISRARENQQKLNEGVESRNKLFEEISKKHRDKAEAPPNNKLRPPHGNMTRA